MDSADYMVQLFEGSGSHWKKTRCVQIYIKRPHCQAQQADNACRFQNAAHIPSLLGLLAIGFISNVVGRTSQCNVMGCAEVIHLAICKLGWHQSTEMLLHREASPGKLGAFEDDLFRNAEMADVPIAAALILGYPEGARTIGIAFCDAAGRTLGTCEFADDEYFCSTESVLVQLGAKEVVMPKVLLFLLQQISQAKSPQQTFMRRPSKCMQVSRLPVRQNTNTLMLSNLSTCSSAHQRLEAT